MAEQPLQCRDQLVLDRGDFQTLIDNLARRDYRVLGPTLRDGAIAYDEVKSTADLPVGWTDEQDGGSYRLKKRGDSALFGYSVGPHAWKRQLYPPVLRLWTASRNHGGFKVHEEPHEAPRLAFLAVRACELKAIALQDQIFMSSSFVDPYYKAARNKSFIVALNCGRAGGTCFCVSMGSGPRVSSGFDIGMTEVMAEGRHYFVVEAGSNQGAEVLAELPCRPACGPERAAAESIVTNTASHMGRALDTADLKALLYRNYEHPRWDEVAERCLTCANCTMVCPTCFCTTVEDVTDLKGEHAERWRKWDSCFTTEFSYIHGGSIRATPRARYRQWLTHKLATWIDQFGTSGCVGCGRCITWCPVAIDLTEEVHAIRETDVSTISRKGNGNGNS